MNPAINVIKEDPRLPDFFEITITYHDKSYDVFKAISHSVRDGVFEIYGTNCLFDVVPMNAIRKISFDKNFTKLQDLMAEKAKETK